MKAYIFPNLNKDFSLECTKEAVDILSNLGYEISMRNELTEAFADLSNVVFCDHELAVKECDVIVTIGGDGTILRIASLAAKHNKKLLGVNCGRLGFMTSHERGELEKLSYLVNGDYNTESRMLLDCIIKKKSGEVISLTALNDIAINHGFNYYISDFTVTANSTTVSSLRADGLIFSTPTGATAYSLSAGGPLIDPTIDCIEFTQICPHSLSARTMIFSAEKELEVSINASGCVGVSIDGNSPVEVTEEDKIIIKRSELRLDLIDIRKNNYYYSIGKKLMNSND